MHESGVDLGDGFRLAHWEVRPRRGTLATEGRTQRIEPRVMGVLACLARHGNEVVTRAEFIREVWDGRVVTDEVLSRCISLLRVNLGDDPREPRFIETVPKIGYRLIATVAPLERTTGRDTLPPAPLVASDQSGTAGRDAAVRSRHRVLLASATLLVVAAAIAYSLQKHPGTSDVSATTPGAADVPLAVLPFELDAGSPDGEHLADGLSDQLAEALAHIHGLRVTGHASSLYFKGHRADPRAIAQTLHVEHLLTGHLRLGEGRLSVTTQLLNGRTGQSEWSETFDRAAGDIQGLPESIARAVAHTLRVRLLEDDELRLGSRPTHDAEAYRLYLEGRARADSGEASDLLAAKSLLDAAVRRDPRFAAAYADLANVIAELVVLIDLPDGDRQGRAAAERAMALDPSLSAAFLARGAFLGQDYWTRGDTSAHELALADYRRAIALDPGNAWAYTVYGYEIQLDDPQLALQLYQRSLVMDPLQRDSQVQQAVVLRLLGRFDEARATLRRMIAFYGDYRRGMQVLGQVERFAGHPVAARTQLEAVARAEGGAYLPDEFYVWSLSMDLGDEASARAALLRLHGEPWLDALSAAAQAATAHRYAEALAVLDRAAPSDSTGRLDIARAHTALLASRPDVAVTVLEHRFPDLLSGKDGINAFNVSSALDLAAALQLSGRADSARNLLGHVTEYLDGSRAPQGPPADYLRAVTHALLGEESAAIEFLARAYAGGFRTLWAVSLVPSAVYLPFDVADDTRLGRVRQDPRFAAWRARIGHENAAQLGRLRPTRSDAA